MSRNSCRRAKQPGQSAVIVALMLPFLLGFSLLVIEVAERWLEVAMVEDALQQATRSAVQQFSYADLARGEERLRATSECRAMRWNQSPRCTKLLSVARRFFITNLAGVRGLNESPADLAQRVSWTVLPSGGTCSYSNAAVPPVSEATPLICAEVRPQMRGIVGWGSFAPLIVAADTLDPIR